MEKIERKEEFVHSRKKKFAYEHVLEDLIFQGFTDTTVNAADLAKMRTLLSAYKSTKDNERQTGTAPCTVPYMQEMDDIFCDSCMVSVNHTINIGTDPQKALTETYVNQSLTELTGLSRTLEDVPSTSRQSRQDRHTTSQIHEPHTVIASPSPRNRKSARERYFEKKLELKKSSVEEKDKFQANMQKMMGDLVRKRNVQVEIEQQKLKIEEEKLKLLQQCFSTE
ncbi:uncharacterized protein LOC128921526 [Zeugodacus cucurbitae]|uniref:uncharacterized protein LOC128921526 n=1 Tax=Zeugodacus cucurbitae TaxID=28588 RepID=UPI0023D8F354|nr:uncharacterized protein LOC128921526 [Zeugodacus cucurbitae]